MSLPRTAARLIRSAKGRRAGFASQARDASAAVPSQRAAGTHARNAGCSFANAASRGSAQEYAPRHRVHVFARRPPEPSPQARCRCETRRDASSSNEETTVASAPSPASRRARKKPPHRSATACRLGGRDAHPRRAGTQRAASVPGNTARYLMTRSLNLSERTSCFKSSSNPQRQLHPFADTIQTKERRRTPRAQQQAR